ncbi:MAG: hypothetical protein R2771_15210 [Saprospiraceae bacterium]
MILILISPLELDTSGFVPGVYVVEYVSFLSETGCGEADNC